MRLVCGVLGRCGSKIFAHTKTRRCHVQRQSRISNYGTLGLIRNLAQGATSSCLRVRTKLHRTRLTRNLAPSERRLLPAFQWWRGLLMKHMLKAVFSVLKHHDFAQVKRGEFSLKFYWIERVEMMQAKYISGRRCRKTESAIISIVSPELPRVCPRNSRNSRNSCPVSPELESRVPGTRVPGTLVSCPRNSPELSRNSHRNPYHRNPRFSLRC